MHYSLKEASLGGCLISNVYSPFYSSTWEALLIQSDWKAMGQHAGGLGMGSKKPYR